MRFFLAAVMGLGLFSGCARSTEQDDFIVPLAGPAKVDVDTPALRAVKAKAGIEDCVAGSSRNELPAVTLPCLGGGPDVALDKLAGPLVISLWGSYCGPCRAELPFYQQLAEEYADKLTVVGIDYTDPQTAKALELLVDTGVTFPQLADPGGELAGRSPLPPLTGLPVMMMVGAGGSFDKTQVKVGAITSYEELENLVKTHLGANL
jgi:thiol-disulfide isomerase/thioredoxin